MTSASGPMVAAATTGLPERAEQGRTHDDRHAWIRDRAHAGNAAFSAGTDSLGDQSVRFVGARLLADGADVAPACTCSHPPGAGPATPRGWTPGLLHVRARAGHGGASAGRGRRLQPDRSGVRPPAAGARGQVTGRAFALTHRPAGTWREISTTRPSRRVARTLGVASTDTAYLSAVAFDPGSFDPAGSTTRSLSRIHESGLTDPVVWTTWFSLHRREGAAAQRWLTESARTWGNDVTWRSADTCLALLYGTHPDGDGLFFTAWGPTARQLLDQIADAWPPASVGVDSARMAPDVGAPPGQVGGHR